MAQDFTGKPHRVNYFKGVLPTMGLLDFEAKKLTFYYGVPGKNQHQETLKYRDMKGAYPVNIMAMFPMGLVLAMKDGTSYRFSTNNRNGIIEHLNERIAACQPHTAQDE